MKIKIDKIIALCVSALLGYYLGLSIFRGGFWRILRWTLPPLNTRHAPRFYTGILGAAIGISLGYLLYIKFIEKCMLEKYKKQYVLGFVALLLLPIITMVSFRAHTISLVGTVETTNPARLTLEFEEPSVGFLISQGVSSSSATVLRKKINLQNNHPLLEALGKDLQELELVEVVEHRDLSRNTMGIMWITYEPDGRWYSKIMNWHHDAFEESLDNQRSALYKGEALETLLEDLHLQVSSLTNYISGKIHHTSLIYGVEDRVNEPMSQEDFQFLLASIHDDNISTPEDTIISRYEAILQGAYISKEDTEFYAFSLSNQTDDTSSFDADMVLENIILYDDALKIAWFEGVYYTVDLSSILHVL